MNYIPFPRLDKDTHEDLQAWRSKKIKKEGDWTSLKSFLNECTKIRENIDSIPKCWFSEFPQADDFALDVEHYRPKNSGNALSDKQKRLLEKSWSVIFKQSSTNGRYPWLTFDYRNYRLVTAKTNRAGAKHIYFPIAAGTERLSDGALPWEQQEYSYFLDPTNKEDTKLLYVKPNGEIAPSTPISKLTDADFYNLPNSWRNSGFNYLRAAITIQLFNLNTRNFILGRAITYKELTRDIMILERLLNENPSSGIIPDLIENITNKILPSAPFSLAAKSALIAYQSPHPHSIQPNLIQSIIQKIISKVEAETDKIGINWNLP